MNLPTDPCDPVDFFEPMTAACGLSATVSYPVGSGLVFGSPSAETLESNLDWLLGHDSNLQTCGA
jgi:hypothetical protein